MARPGSAVTAGAAPRPLGLVRTVAALVELTKPGILQLLVLTTICAMFVAERGVPNLGLMLWTLLGTVLVCGSANSVNMVWDRDIDVLMGRTAHRPLVTGRLSVPAAIVWAAALGIAGVAVLGLKANWLAAAMGISGHLFYVVIYTMWLKRRTPQNIVIGGAAGAFPPLIGYAAVAGELDLAAWMIFAIIFLWTPPHFWALALYKDTDYGAARVPMMPNVRGKLTTKRQMVFYMALLLGCTSLLTYVGAMGLLYTVSAALLGLVFLYCVIQTLRDNTEAWAKRTFAFSIVYLGILFGAMSADSIINRPLIASHGAPAEAAELLEAEVGPDVDAVAFDEADARAERARNR